MSYRLLIAPKVILPSGVVATKVATYTHIDPEEGLPVQTYPHSAITSPNHMPAIVLVFSATDDWQPLLDDPEILDPFQRSFDLSQRNQLRTIRLRQIINQQRAVQIRNWLSNRGVDVSDITLDSTLREFFKRVSDQLGELGYEIEGNWTT